MIEKGVGEATYMYITTQLTDSDARLTFFVVAYPTIDSLYSYPAVYNYDSCICIT